MAMRRPLASPGLVVICVGTARSARRFVDQDVVDGRTLGAFHWVPDTIGMIQNATSANPVPWTLEPAEAPGNAINAAGGVERHKTMIDYCDGQCSVEEAGVCAQKPLAQDKVNMLVADGGIEAAAIDRSRHSGRQTHHGNE